MPNCQRQPPSNFKRDRAVAIKTKEPNLSYSDIAERLGIDVRQVKRWLTPTGLGQMRTEDRRGQIGASADASALPYPNHTPDMANVVGGAVARAAAVEMKRKSMSLTAAFVAHELGVAVGTVMRWWREAGLVPSNAMREERASEAL